MSTSVAHGATAVGFEVVGEVFARNFTEPGELGAAFAAFSADEPLVDIWGGVADDHAGTQWAADTLQLIFSGTKGLVAICVLLLADRGLLNPDAPVARYWPEFAAAGKDTVRVREVLSHQARLPGIASQVDWQDAADASAMAARIATQPQSTDPRATATYHPLTFGWICAELVLRITGSSIGCFFAQEIAEPLGLDLWIGLPAQHQHRVARVELAADWGVSSVFTPEEVQRDDLIRSVAANPRRFDRDNLPWNKPLWHAAEIPGANAIGTARSIARLYASLPSLLAPETIALASRPLTAGQDTLSGRPIAFSTGFQLQQERMPFGPPPDAFGHGGAGGSRHGYWPSTGVGFSYAMNLLRDDATDTRATRLLQALHHALERAS